MSPIYLIGYFRAPLGIFGMNDWSSLVNKETEWLAFSTLDALLVNFLLHFADDLC